MAVSCHAAIKKAILFSFQMVGKGVCMDRKRTLAFLDEVGKDILLFSVNRTESGLRT